MRGTSVGFLSGTVGNQPELNTGKTGTRWTRLSLAVNRSDGQGGETPDWWDVALFGRSAEMAHKLLKPGTRIVVHGDLEIESWVDQEGRPRKNTRLKANDFQITHYPNPKPEQSATAPTRPTFREPGDAAVM